MWQRARGRGLSLLVLGALVAGALAVPVGLGQDADAFMEVADPAGDVAVGTAGAGGLPSGPVVDAVDIRALRVVEDDGRFLNLEIAVEDLGDGSPAGAAASYRYQVVFAHERIGVTYEVAGDFSGADFVSGDPVEGRMDFCWSRDGGSHCYGGFDFVRITAYPGEDRVLFEIPKAVLTGDIDTGFASSRDESLGTIEKGDRLTAWHAEASARADSIFVPVLGSIGNLVVDEAPDAGQEPPVYELRTSMANTNLVLSSPLAVAGGGYFEDQGTSQEPTDPSGAAVVIGAGTRIPVRLTNEVSRKHMVNLTAQVSPGDEEKWDVRLVPALELPGKATRQLAVQVNASQALAHRDTTMLTVQATSLVDPGEVGVVQVPLRAVAVPTRDWNEVYFHAAALKESAGPLDPGPACEEDPELCYTTPRWLSPLAEDPADNIGGENLNADGWFNIYTDDTVSRMTLWMDSGPTEAVRLDGGLVEVTVSLRADRAMDATVTAHLVAGAGATQAGVTLGQGSTDTALGDEPADVTISFPVDPAQAVVRPETGVLGLMLEVSSQDAVGGNSPTTLVEYRPADSVIRLPVEPLGNATSSPGVGLYPQTETEEFVNPGKTRLLPFLLVNEGTEAARLDVEAGTDAKDWSVEVKPGSSYQLEPGASVNATLMVQAPEAAKEGDTAEVTLAIQRPGGDEAAQASYTLIVATGVVIEDEREAYEEDPDAVAKVAGPDEGADSPGLALVGVVAAAGLGLWWRRRPQA